MAYNSDHHASKHGMMAKDQADSDFDLLQHDKEQAIEAQQQHHQAAQQHHQAAQQHHQAAQQQPEAEPPQENMMLNDRPHQVLNRRVDRQGLDGVIAAKENNKAANDDDPDLCSSFCTQNTDHSDNLTIGLTPVIRFGASRKVSGRPAQAYKRVLRQ